MDKVDAYLFHNVTVTDPQSPHNGHEVDMRVAEGMITDIAAAGTLSPKASEQVVEGEQVYVSPGWIDLQVQPAIPGFEYKESLDALASAALKGGVTAFLYYPNTHPVIDSAQQVKALKVQTQDLPVEALLTGTITQGAAGKELAELYDMQQAGAVAFTDGSHALQSSGMLMRALQYTQAFDGLLITYPGDEELAAGGQMNESKTSAFLGMKGIPELAEVTKSTQFQQIHTYAGGRLHLQPITSPDALALLSQAKTEDSSLTIGTTAAHLALDDSLLESFDSNYKVFPPLRDKEQVEALKKAVKAGFIDTISSGHHAQTVEEKQMEFSFADQGMIGLQTLFSVAYEALVDSQVISLDHLVACLATQPRRILGLPPMHIAVGQPVSLSLFQPQKDWIFNSSHLFSRSHNSPFLDKSLKARVFGTYTKGVLHLV